MKTLNYHQQEQKEKKDALIGKMIGCLLVPFLLGLFYMWYNHVLFQWSIPYWKWAILGTAIWFFCPKWLNKIIDGLLFAIAGLGQVLAWLSFVHLPLIH